MGLEDSEQHGQKGAHWYVNTALSADIKRTVVRSRFGKVQDRPNMPEYLSACP